MDFMCSNYQTIHLSSCSEALGKAENATKRLATVSKDVLKALEVANPKETKK